MLIKNFDFYNGTGALSNECAIKNSVSSVENLSALREFTSYKENKSLSLMFLYLSEFFVLNSNEFVHITISDVKKYLIDISNGLDDNQRIDNFNYFLYQKIRK